MKFMKIIRNYFWLMWLLYVSPRLLINTHPPTSTNPNCLALEKKKPFIFLMVYIASFRCNIKTKETTCLILTFCNTKLLFVFFQ